MKKSHYVITRKAWYWQETDVEHAWVDEVYFYTVDPSGEMVMRWYALGDGTLPSPRLEVFIESAYAFASLPEILGGLAYFARCTEEMTRQDFCELLGKYGFVDGTPYNKPA